MCKLAATVLQRERYGRIYKSLPARVCIYPPREVLRLAYPVTVQGLLRLVTAAVPLWGE